jgi:hypothetical protein
MLHINVMTPILRKILRSRRWRESHSEYSRTWFDGHRTEKRAYYTKWRKNNLKKCSEMSRQWRQDNPEKAREIGARWAKDNPLKVAAIHHRRRARKTGAGGSFTTEQFKALGNVCLGCGRSEPELIAAGLMLVPDHVLPIALGGSNDISNIQPLCHGHKRGAVGGCNNHKGARYIDYRSSTLRE